MRAYQNADHQVANETTGQILAATSIGSAAIMTGIGGTGALLTYGAEITTGALYTYGYISMYQTEILDSISGVFFNPGDGDSTYSFFNGLGTWTGLTIDYMKDSMGCE